MNEEEFVWNMNYWSEQLTLEQAKIEAFYARITERPYANPTLVEMEQVRQYILRIGAIEANLKADVSDRKANVPMKKPRLTWRNR